MFGTGYEDAGMEGWKPVMSNRQQSISKRERMAYGQYRAKGGQLEFQTWMTKQAGGKSMCRGCKTMRSASDFEMGAKMCAGCMTAQKKEAQYLDHQRVPADIRRHKIDQHIGRVNHLGHPYKGNDVVFAPNDVAYQDLLEGRQPNHRSPRSIEYFTEMALRGMESGIYWDGNAAYRGVTAAEDARYMHDHEKIRLAENIRGSGIWVDDDTVKDVLSKGNEIERLERADAGERKND